MEAQTSLIRADCAVELYAITDVYLYISLIVDPRNTEHVDTLGLYDALNDLCLLELGMLIIDIFDRD